MSKNKKNENRFSIYDIGSIDCKNNDNDNRLPFEPTAVLTNGSNKPPTQRFSIYDISSVDFKNDDYGLPYPYEPTAVLTKSGSPPTNTRKTITHKGLLDLDLSRIYLKGISL